MISTSLSGSVFLAGCQSVNHISGVHADNPRIMPCVHICRIHWAGAYYLLGIHCCNNHLGKLVIYIGQKFGKTQWRKDVLHMGRVPRTVLAVVAS